MATKFEKPGAKGLAIILFVSFFTLDSLLIEPYALKTTHSEFDLFDEGGIADDDGNDSAGNRDGAIRIVFISDMHIGLQRDGYLGEVVRAVNAQEPDLILIGGDSIEASEAELDKLEPLRNLSAAHGAYAILGNHDYGIWGCAANPALSDKVEAKLESLGIDVLRNENRTLDVRGGRFAIIGLDDAWSCRNDYASASAGLDDALPKIIFTHNQAGVDASEIKGRGLILSGHTHCGQIRLPIITGLLLGPGFGRTVGGYERLNNDTEAYVTCGVTSGTVRFLSNPEISVIEIE